MNFRVGLQSGLRSRFQASRVWLGIREKILEGRISDKSIWRGGLVLKCSNDKAL